jgi:hypothetical protein
MKPLKEKNIFYNLPWLINVFLIGFIMFNVIPRLQNYFGWQCIPGLKSIRHTLRHYVPICIGIAIVNWLLAYRFKCKPFVAGAMALALILTTIAIYFALKGQ